MGGKMKLLITSSSPTITTKDLRELSAEIQEGFKEAGLKIPIRIKKEGKNANSKKTKTKKEKTN